MGIGSDMPVAVGVPLCPPTSSGVMTSSPNLSSTPPIESSRPISIPNLRLSSQENLSTEVIQTLKEQGYSRGLIDALWDARQMFPLRIWIVDNSGSMMMQDGHRILEERNRKKGIRFASCSRWAEMQQTIQYHAQLAATLQQPTIFRLLNDPGKVVGPQQFSVAADKPENIDQELSVATSIMMNASPGGVTPLSEHIHEIRSTVMALEPMLRQDGTKVTIVIATDGLPTTSTGICNSFTKNEFRDALKSLQGLPVWVVIRLSTDDDEVVEYYNELDNQLELSLEVLDDFAAEAKEVNAENKWLNYALPIHRMREMGFHHRVFDLLDERKLSKGELRDFFRILLGNDAMSGAPDAESDWNGFCSHVDSLLGSTDKQWNPKNKRLESWINMKKLKREYHRGLLSCFL